MVKTEVCWRGKHVGKHSPHTSPPRCRVHLLWDDSLYEQNQTGQSEFERAVSLDEGTIVKKLGITGGYI